MYNWFYWFVPFSENDEQWIKYLSPLIFVALAIGIFAAFLFVFTKTREANSRKQNSYWWIIYTCSIALIVIVLWVVKNSVENNADDSEPFSFDLAGIITAIAGTCVYAFIFYYIFTVIFRRIPRHNPKRYFPTFVKPHTSRLNK